MNMTEFLEKWGRSLFEAPLAALPRPQEPPELAEIRLAVLDQVQAKSYRSGGKKIFPFDLVRLRLHGLEETQCAVFNGRFFRRYLEQEVRSALQNAGCRFPEDLRILVNATPGQPQPGAPWLVVETAQQTAADTAQAAAKLSVRIGTANVTQLPLVKARTNIGRSGDVVRSEGIFRRNDLAFADNDDLSRSVSREHAHIIFDKSTGEYRLFNDRWYALGSHDCGTWIVRDGMSQEVHRNGRGTKLEAGDEIHLGRVVLVFENG